jgi:crotonobetainyl-CoA:carnitine CoA-transferase CaiB-like acyl-CoA transferase
MLLADLGADVIKIERPHTGDDTRHWGPPFWNGMSTYFAAINRGKRSLAIDLGTEFGQMTVRELVEKADIVVENFRPGVTRRLGISYEQVCGSNPGLIYASISGFGSHGPRAQQAGTEVIVEAESGLMAMMGLPDGPPVRFGVAMVDIATGMSLVNGVLAAMLERTRTGRGRAMEFPLYATAISVLGTVIASAGVSPGARQARFGSGHPSIVPYSAFEATDGWVVLGAVNDGMWLRLCEGLDLQHLLDDQRCISNEARVNSRAFVEETVAKSVAALTVADVERRLGKRGVLVAPVRTASEAIRDPQVVALGLLDDDDGLAFSRTPLALFSRGQLSRAPALGQDTRDVLAAYGVPPERIAKLLADGIVHEADIRDSA